MQVDPWTLTHYAALLAAIVLLVTVRRASAKAHSTGRTLSYGLRDAASSARAMARAAAREISLGMAALLLVAGAVAWAHWPRTGQDSWSGSGFSVAKGVLITNHHVADACTKLVAVAPDGRSTALSVISSDKKSDLALVRMAEDIGGDPLPLRDAPPLTLGERVYAMGYPLGTELGVGPKLTEGMVSGVVGYGNDASEVQFSATIMEGSSGGAVVDAGGSVVAVSSAGVDGTENSNFGVRIHLAKALMQASRIEHVDAQAPDRSQAWDPTSFESTLASSVILIVCEGGNADPGQASRAE